MKFNVVDKVLEEATIEKVDIENGQYDVRISDLVSDLGICMKEDKVHSTDTAAKTYEDGLADAWDLAKKIICGVGDGGFSMRQLKGIYGDIEIEYVFNFTAQEALAKIAEWESGRELHVGDIVTDYYGNKDVVTGIDGQKETDTVCILRANGFATTVFKNELTKTGRTIDITRLLAQIRGAEDA